MLPAQQHDAYLTGLSALDLLMPTRPVVRPRGNPEVDTQPGSQLMNWGAVPPVDYPEADRQAAETAERIEAAFREQLRFSGLLGDWRVASGQVSETVVCQARHADLVILGQIDPEHPPPPEGRQLVEDVLMTSGRPILVIPYIGRFETLATKILVGWNNSREAARAVTTPFLFSSRPRRSPFWRRTIKAESQRLMMPAAPTSFATSPVTGSAPRQRER